MEVTPPDVSRLASNWFCGLTIIVKYHDLRALLLGQLLFGPIKSFVGCACLRVRLPKSTLRAKAKNLVFTHRPQCWHLFKLALTVSPIGLTGPIRNYWCQPYKSDVARNGNRIIGNGKLAFCLILPLGWHFLFTHGHGIYYLTPVT